MRGIALPPQNGATHRNVAWVFHFGELNLLHPGALTEPPPPGLLDPYGELHVLLLPLGATAVADGAAATLVARLEPRCILPVCHDDAAEPLERFLGALDLGRPQAEELLRVTAGNLPEQPRVVTLRPRPLPE